MCEADIKILWQKVVLRLVVVQLLPWPSLWYIISLSSLYNILRLVILKLRPWLPLFATNTQNCITVGYPASSSVATIICHKYKNHLPQMQKIVLQLVIVQLLSWPPLGTGSNNQNGNSRWFLPLGVDPPLNGTIFFPHFFSFAIESYIYETDFTLGLSQKYHF